MKRWLSITPLKGKHVTLEPLTLAHVEGLQQAVQDGEYWKLWYTTVPHPDAMKPYVVKAMDAMEKGEIAFAVREKSSGEIMGTTRIYAVDEKNRRGSLGYTWYAARVCRSPVNTECKFLLLEYLFEQHDAIAVEFHTHRMNFTSRAAIERLGAQLDGILRQHQIMPDGSIRDTACYSIIAAEWAMVKTHLQAKMGM